jgi:hypothetical protein
MVCRYRRRSHLHADHAAGMIDFGVLADSCAAKTSEMVEIFWCSITGVHVENVTFNEL